MAQNAGEPTRDPNHISLRRAEGDCKREPNRDKSFQCVQSENQIAPLLSKHSQHIGGTNIPATVFPDVNSAGSRDEKPIWARAEKIPNTRRNAVN